MGYSRREWPLHCCICFSRLTPETCAIDADGTKWDVCRGQCSTDAGLTETFVATCGGEPIAAADMALMEHGPQDN